MKQENEMKAIVELVSARMPGFVDACAADVDVVLMSQDAFPKLDAAELMLLGAAIKYAGFKGKDVTISVPAK